MKNPFQDKYRSTFVKGGRVQVEHIKTHPINADRLSPCDKVFDLVHQAIHIGVLVGDFGGKQLTEPQCVAIGNSSELQIMSQVLPSLSSSSTSTQSKGKVIPQLQERSNQNSFQFPWKLHDMLDTAAEEGFDDIVSWDDGGRAFKVHKTQIFVDSIMGRWFKQSKYKSFQRQLNLYGFSRLNHGPQKGGYAHPKFVRGQRAMCQLVTRGSGAESDLTGTESSKDSVPPSAGDALIGRSPLQVEAHRGRLSPLAVAATNILAPARSFEPQYPNVVIVTSGSNSGTSKPRIMNDSFQVELPKEFQFPWKLYEMLDRSTQESFEHIVSWQPGDSCFKVHEPQLFVSVVLPRFFRQTKYKSFQRQLNLYGFARIDDGPNRGAYRHPFFLKGRNELLNQIPRQKDKQVDDDRATQQIRNSSQTAVTCDEKTTYSKENSGIPAIIAAIEYSESEMKKALHLQTTHDPLPLVGCMWRKNIPANFSDWCIEVLETETRIREDYYLHRQVLALGPRRSEYFARVCNDSNANCDRKSLLELGSMEAQVFPMILDHMYSNSTIDVNNGNAYALYSLGDQLEISSVLLSVTEFYTKSMSKDNIIDFLAIGESFRDKRLLCVALDRCTEELHSIDKTTASRIKPHWFLEVLRRNKSRSSNDKCGASRLSELVVACMEGHPYSVTLDLFNSLVNKDFLPCIESTAAIKILAFQQEWTKQVCGGVDDSLKDRCVYSITNDWPNIREKLKTDSTLQTIMKVLSSNLLFEILMTTTGSP